MLARAGHAVIVGTFELATPPHQRVPFDKAADMIYSLAAERASEDSRAVLPRILGLRQSGKLVSALVAAHGTTAVAQAALSWYSCAHNDHGANRYGRFFTTRGDS